MRNDIHIPPIKLLVFLLLLAAAAIGGYRLWNYLDSYESTDDAQIDGDIYSITSRIAGTVTAVHNFVAGDLIEIKPAGGGEPLMVPFTDASVPKIDMAGRRMIVVPLAETE